MNKLDYIPALRFHWLTPYYDAVVGITTRERTFKQALIKQACIEPGMRVLDLACGTGTLTVWIKQVHTQAEVIGVDGDRNILKLAIKKSKKANVDVQFDCAMSDKLPYSSSHFDRVVSSLFFHHLSWENKQRTVLEIYRVLKPDAEVLIADWGKPSNFLMSILFLFVQLLDGFKNTQENKSGKLIELLEYGGFKDTKQLQSFNTIFGTLVLYSAKK